MGAAEPPISQECVEGYLYCTRPTRVLILRRPPARGSIWVPVSGKVDPTDRDYPSALRRELAEETGFHEFVRSFALDWDVPFEGPDGKTWRLHAFAVELERAEAPVLSPEHDAFEWVAPAEAIARLHYEDNREAVRRLETSLRSPRSDPSPKV
ncbi:MAG: NUDIX domain-containing protein [Thermoplasmata archaeon]|nr:NUDIX domain-containing protein [Thermoplasmata archaeon]MCI4353926.1 NUDIX domain-containing protein [Thermoplasmata archaeon]